MDIESFVRRGQAAQRAVNHAILSHTIRVDRDGLVRCRVCSCTEREPCEPPCSWAEEDLCSWCSSVAESLADFLEGAHRPSLAPLLREVKAIVAHRNQPTARGASKGGRG
jgi:hypothetical protein